MASCLLPTIQILQPTTTNPVLRPKLSAPRSQTKSHPQSPYPSQRRRKHYPAAKEPSSRNTTSKMRASLLRISALTSILGLSSAQSTWAQSQPFDVDVSTDSLLSSADQPLTNIVGTNTPSNTALLPAISVTEQFSASIPTELSTMVAGGQTSLVFVTDSSASASASASETGSAASSRSAAASSSVSASRSASASASQSGTGASQQSTAAAAPTGVSGQQKMLGMAGALAGAAGVLFV